MLTLLLNFFPFVFPYSPLFFSTSPGYINSLSLSELFLALQLPVNKCTVKSLWLPIPYTQISIRPWSSNVICWPRLYPLHKQICNFTGKNTNQTSCPLAWEIPIEHLHWKIPTSGQLNTRRFEKGWFYLGFGWTMHFLESSILSENWLKMLWDENQYFPYPILTYIWGIFLNDTTNKRERDFIAFCELLRWNTLVRARKWVWRGKILSYFADHAEGGQELEYALLSILAFSFAGIAIFIIG